jgi:hypothetical protein
MEILNVTSVQYSRERALSLPERLRRYSGLISLFGLLIVIGTFVVKDVLRDNQKDLVDSLEATRNVWFLSESIDDVQKSLEGILYKLHRLEILNMGVTDPSEKTKKSIDNAKKDLTLSDERLKSLKATYNLLYAKLPANIQVEADKSLKHLTALEALQRQESALLKKPDPQSEDQASQLETEISQFSGMYWKETKRFTDETHNVLDLFERQYVSANCYLKIFTYISYVLYPAGILIGILGQVAGVKPPGGE